MPLTPQEQRELDQLEYEQLLAEQQAAQAQPAKQPQSSGLGDVPLPIGGGMISANQIRGAGPAIADMGMEGVGAAGGQALGAATGPAAPVAVPALGAIGGALGNAAGQVRGKIMGDRKEFSLGEILAAGVAGSVPGGSLVKAGAKTVLKEAGKQGLTNIAAKQAQVAVDEGRMLTGEEALMAGGGGVLGVAAMKGLDKGVRVTRATTKAIQNAVRDKTLMAARQAGYVIPPSQINPSGINHVLESIAGKADTAQEAAIRNQEITNALAKKAIGLPGDAPLTEKLLADARDAAAQPYRDVAALPGGDKLVEELKQTRWESNAQHKFYNQSANPDALKKAVKLHNDAEQLEVRIEQLASAYGQPDLIDRLRASRTQIAKIYDVEKALNKTDGNIAAQVLARAEGIGKKSKYSGDLETIADFANTYKLSARLGSDVRSPGVSALRPALSAGFGGMGYKLAGAPGAAAGLALPFVAPTMARNTILSKPYQNLMASPFYGSTTMGDTGANAFRLAVDAGARK